MIKCLICGKECVNKLGLSSHNKLYHKITAKDYYDKFFKKDEEGKCLLCGKETKFRDGLKGYLKYCSKECEKNNMYVTMEKVRDKVFEKYGVEHALYNKEIQEKRKQTNLKKYGVEFVSQNKEIQDKQKETIKEKYGVENISQLDEIKDKKKQKSLNKFGTEYVLQSKEVIEKRKNNLIEKYGVENISQLDCVKDKKYQKVLSKQLIKIEKHLKYLDIKLLDEYHHNREILNFKCLKCDNIYKTNYFDVQRGFGKCPICFPKYRSIGEQELSEFLKSLNLNIVESDRNIIYPYELDIYIPDKNIAIEYDGLYYHSEEMGKDRYYHLNKTLECEKKNIQLIHIFEDEWINKRNIVENKLKDILNIYEYYIDISQCEIKELNSNDVNDFLNKYNIYGNDHFDINISLFYQNELISVMSFDKENDDIYNLSNFVINSDYHNSFIFYTLLDYFKENYNWKEIYYILDRRFPIHKYGFKLISIIEPKHYYVKSECRYDPEITNFDEYDRIIWNCGYFKFQLINEG